MMSGLLKLSLSQKAEIWDIFQSKGILHDEKEVLPPPPIVLEKNTESAFFTKQRIDDLHSKGFFVLDNWLGLEFAKEAHKAANSLYESGTMKHANMRTQQETWKDQRFRGDSICFLQKETTAVPFQKILNHFEIIRKELDTCFDFQTTRMESQLACYDSNGTRYVRHVDGHKGGPTRRLTFLYYMNEDWIVEKGGALRIWSCEKQMDIEPVADRLLVFSSQYLPHEVLPCYFRRFALATWIG